MKPKEYGDIVAAMTEAELAREIKMPKVLKFCSEKIGWRRIEMAWAPFDPINKNAKVAVLGITPGREQMATSLQTYRNERLRGATHTDAAMAGKRTGAFAGDMRDTLVRILDEIAISDYLGIQGSASLWGLDAKHVHFSSALRWPVFVETKDKLGRRCMENYTGGSPAVTSQLVFKKILLDILTREIGSLPADCLIAPLGAAATRALSFACEKIVGFDQGRLLVGLPHPSGAARDVSSQFLGDPPSPTRKKALSPSYRQDALRLRKLVLELPVITSA